MPKYISLLKILISFYAKYNMLVFGNSRIKNLILSNQASMTKECSCEKGNDEDQNGKRCSKCNCPLKKRDNSVGKSNKVSSNGKDFGVSFTARIHSRSRSRSPGQHRDNGKNVNSAELKIDLGVGQGEPKTKQNPFNFKKLSTSDADESSNLKLNVNVGQDNLVAAPSTSENVDIDKSDGKVTINVNIDPNGSTVMTKDAFGKESVIRKDSDAGIVQQKKHSKNKKSLKKASLSSPKVRVSENIGHPLATEDKQLDNSFEKRKASRQSGTFNAKSRVSDDVGPPHASNSNQFDTNFEIEVENTSDDL